MAGKNDRKYADWKIHGLFTDSSEKDDYKNPSAFFFNLISIIYKMAERNSNSHFDDLQNLLHSDYKLNQKLSRTPCS